MGDPTRLPDGVNTEPEFSPLFFMPSLNPAAQHRWFDDFDGYTAGDWIVTETQVGATQGVANLDGGILQLVNSAADNDLNAIQWAKETFKIDTTKRAWMLAKFKVDQATLSDVVVGLQITDTTPLAVTDGIFFRKSEAGTTLNLVVCKNSTETVTAVATMADDTYVEVGFDYDTANSKINVYLKGSSGWNRVGSSVVTNLPDDEELCISIAVQNGSAAARTLSVDYLLVARAR